MSDVEVGVLKGKTLVSIEGEALSDLFFTCTDGSSYRMYHEQDCCEHVSLEDVVGD